MVFCRCFHRLAFALVLGQILLALAAFVFVALCVYAAFSVWLLRLTGQSSRFAFGERLTFVR